MRLFRKLYDTPQQEKPYLENDLLDAQYLTHEARTLLFGSLTMTSCMTAILLGFVVLCILAVVILWFADNGDLLGFILHHYWPNTFPPVYGW